MMALTISNLLIKTDFSFSRAAVPTERVRMSSFRNAVKRKTHKERSQPEGRKRFGLLEKHKDYVVRAKDYNKKKKRIQALKEKAAFRNPDEFYMKMQSMATKRGVHTNLGEDSIDADTLKLFKTQDLSYITLKKQSEQTKIGVFVCLCLSVSLSV